MSLMKGLMAMTTKAFRYGDALLADITALRHEGKTFDQIAKRLSTKYKVDLSTDGVRKQFAKYGNLTEISDNETEILRLRDVARTRRASSRTARENRQILEYLDGVDEVVARMRDLTKLVRPVNIRKVKLPEVKHVKFVIPTKSYTTVQIYGNNILLDHGHNAAGGGVTRKSAMAWMGSRQAQLGMLLHGACYGHSHYPQMMGRGEITINGSLCGDDSFADELGLTSFLGGPVQVINTYLETTSRPSCFYTNFPVFLK